MSSFLGLLPSTSAGYLPVWMLFVSTVAVFNTVQNYLTPTLTKQVYAGAPAQVTPLSNRTFGVWTFTSALIRLYAAYNITSPPLYNLALASYFIAFAHFNSELLIYKTCVFGKGWAGPAVVSTISITWMLMQRNWYLSGI